MYEEYSAKLTQAETALYLERIGLAGETIPITREGLDRLVFAHLCSVPFENLDICLFKRPIDFSVPRMYEKVVTERRGGYCFELNSIFMALLQSLGFDAYPVGVRIVFRRDFVPPIAHRASIVTLDDKRYMADVGYGGPAPGGSVCIEDGSTTEVLGESYGSKISGDGIATLIKHTEDGEMNFFIFDSRPFNPIDFIAPNFQLSNSPESFFAVKRMANLRRGNGSCSIDADIFRVYEGGEKTETAIENDEQLYEILAKNFGIVPPSPIAAEA